MSTKNKIQLEVDHHRRIGIADVISMLKGLRSEAVIKINQATDTNEGAKELGINNKNRHMDQHHISSQCSLKNSPAVKGNTDLPQIRELNEIAALLRSMNMQQAKNSS